MNYIRGAVNAISAPYQYYKELPPINPSTLTGAIDVIVIQRPGSDGETELACSPFHVRFGKWQVLRPSEKKVNVSVNGQPIPYSMKIGEAGEAFFVFETDEDVPDELITSPLLQPTRPEEEATATTTAQIDNTTTRFGAKPELEDLPQNSEIQSGVPPETIGEANLNSETPQEPDYFDLDAGTGSSRKGKAEEEGRYDTNITPKQTFHRPPFIRRYGSHSTINNEESSKTLGLPSPPPSRSPTPEMEEQDKRVDEALKILSENVESPEVEYHHDVVLDVEGYHLKENFPTTRRSSLSTEEKFAFPSRPRRSRPPTPTPPLLGSQTVIHSTHNSSPSDSDSESNEPSTSMRRVRATSEPPPDTEESHHRPASDAEFIYDDHDFSPSRSRAKNAGTMKIPTITTSGPKVQEYSWEWGAFPTPSPMKTTFGKGGRLEGWKGKARQMDDLRVQGQGSEVEQNDDDDEGELSFGTGGRLSAAEGDEATFVLSIDHRKVNFQLSCVEEEHRGSGSSSRHTRDEVEMARLFEEGKITFSRFLEDESLVNDSLLVIKWGEGQYVTRQDGSPLLDALVLWRENALKAQDSKESSEEEEEREKRHGRSKSEPPTQEQKLDIDIENNSDERKPASLSWAQWWSRSRKREADKANAVGGRPMLRAPQTAPFSEKTDILQKTSESLPELVDSLKGNSSTEGERESGSAPALPSTPEEVPSKGSPNTTTPEQQQTKKAVKFAKTLRLTSDQLKALDLKPGANTITFSISSGVIACTARIFVWEYTDLVVISDIDGTITKSDGLGHVFAMIGRDWTHVGVAKLYTDIVRNGYKIMYLTSRAIGQADATRGYLKGIKQNNYQLPEGPVIMSPDRLMASLHREVIMRKPEVFKMACLRDIQRLFSEHSKSPFYAGFGNRITDALSYRSVNVPSARIFTIDSSGEVKMELLELAGYKSSYIHMTDLVDQMFPPIHKKWTPEYTDFNYWKIPMVEYPLPDLTPPSPTLSARSDTSNQSTLAKLRNFRIMGSRANSLSITATNERSTGNFNNDINRETELRQMTSFERIVSGLKRSVSPSVADSDSESDVDGYSGAERRRRRSITSMPGSLDDMHWGLDDEEDEDDEDERHVQGQEQGISAYGEDGSKEYGGDDAYEDEVDEESAIEQDLWDAVEMNKVPFL